MQLIPTFIAGVMQVALDKHEDKRGYFARIFCEETFGNAGISFSIRQANISFNPQRGTLRGMHFQTAPKEEPKLVRCTQGRVYDVVIDLRQNSPTHCRWYGIELSQENGLGLFIPAGCAHGFLTLDADSELLYLMGETYDPAYASGVRWDDPVFDIQWPEEPSLMSPRDASWQGYLP